MRNIARWLEDNHWVPLTILILLVRFIRADLGTSLWLDELVTTWVSDSHVAERAIAFQGQSPLFFLLIQKWRSLFGSSELILRIPSVVMTLLAVGIVARLERRFVGERWGLSPLIYSVSCEIQQTISVRPYLFAVVATLLATDSLIRFEREGRRISAYFWACWLALAYYFHFLFVAVALVHLLWGLLFARGRLKSIIGPVILLGFLLLPGLLQVKSLVDRRTELNFINLPDLIGTIRGFVPLEVLVSLFLGLFLAKIVWPQAALKWSADRKLLFRLGLWAFLVPLLALVWSFASGTVVFLPRYLLWAGPGVALFLAEVVRSSSPRQFQFGIVTWIGAFLLMAEMQRHWVGEGWRDIAAEVRSSGATQLLMYSGLQESESIEWWQNNEERKNYVRCPAAYYNFGTTVIPIPGLLQSTSASEYLKSTLNQGTKSASSLLVLLVRPVPNQRENSRQRILSAVNDQGFKETLVQRAGIVELYRLTKNS